MTKEIRYNISDITNGECNRNAPRDIKMEILAVYINLDRYTVLGFEENGSVVCLKPKFHNKRDSKGRFMGSSKK